MGEAPSGLFSDIEDTLTFEVVFLAIGVEAEDVLTAVIDVVVAIDMEEAGEQKEGGEDDQR